MFPPKKIVPGACDGLIWVVEMLGVARDLTKDSVGLLIRCGRIAGYPSRDE